ncbi:MAG: dihydrodipicolinate synthase family protein [Alphaproteobacteria bacterium]|nr:dihydrodipicolinate synthase family protein [Alphaproteobacteria bacterium]MBU1552977.1 dihydrodipicolinate synthase family protein [Alphaproteobacteria bacterium]MBU2338263.1 dihydrodipicolinate synthase family protein [Alphaproteobacteria bacterium]MBU2388242.1 dihydrodipicolinate synthase family protein [Alphaproteobacteria bacterium]
MTHAMQGIFPVVITPFHSNDTIDWDGYGRLIEWYLAHGSSGLFAVCQSSEMVHLSLQERRDLARFTVEQVAGRVPVVASGHVSEAMADQKAELQAIADTGVDAVVLVTNRLAAANEDSAAFQSRLNEILGALPTDMPLGLYECPAPYRRLLTDEEVTWCAQSGRFAFLKDVCCDLPHLKRRLSLVAGTPLAINNANAAIAWPAIQAGAHGFSGVMNNFHPDLYRWIMDHGRNHPDLAAELDTFLVLSAMSEGLGYPKLAKHYHHRIGTFSGTHSRTVPYELGQRHWAVEVVLDHIVAGAARFRDRIAALNLPPRH